MNKKPWKVINEHGVPWALRFKTEEAAWGRLLSLMGYLEDTKANRQALIRRGFVVKLAEVNSTPVAAL